MLERLDRRLGKRVGRLSPVDARHAESLRLWRESWKEGTIPGQVTVLTAKDLSLQLQLIAARIEDETDAAIIAAERRRIEAVWRVVHDLDLARTESRDPKAILLRYVEQARESDLDIAKQVRFVVRYVSEADAAFASRLDLALLRSLLLAWDPKRGRPKKAEAKRPINSSSLPRCSGVQRASTSRHPRCEGTGSARVRVFASESKTAVVADSQ